MGRGASSQLFLIFCAPLGSWDCAQGAPRGGAEAPGAQSRELGGDRRESVCNPALLGVKVHFKTHLFDVGCISMHLHASCEHPRITL